MATLYAIEKTLTIQSGKNRVDPWKPSKKWDELLDVVEAEYDKWPEEVKDRAGRTVRIIHTSQGTEGELFSHLTMGLEGKPDRERSAWLPFVPHTIEHAEYVLVQDPNRQIYVCLYHLWQKTIRHLVIVDNANPEGVCELLTQFDQEAWRNNKHGRMEVMKLEKKE